MWQVTGDDAWIKWALPYLEKALYHSMSNPIRWSREYQLVKRPFTIDTWDFVYNRDGMHRFSGYGEIDANSNFCIMHGDNTGVYQSCRMLAFLCTHLDDSELGEYWERKAEYLKQRINRICWNGKFFIHQVHIDPVEIENVDEKKQLSLSNAYALNRGILTHEQSVSIIEEYIRRREETKDEYFAEWFSIHPPFPDHSFHAKNYKGWCINRGWYVNGGVLPLVGGELAKGAFENGFEEYGLDILKRYYDMISKTGKSYLWYHPDGRPGISSKNTLPTDGWGSAAMLRAYIEGLVGVKDKSKLLQNIRLSPRWAVTQATELKVNIGYQSSGVYFSYNYKLDRRKSTISLGWKGNAKGIFFHILLPKSKQAVRVRRGNQILTFQKEKIRESSYANFRMDDSSGRVEIDFT